MHLFCQAVRERSFGMHEYIFIQTSYHLLAMSACPGGRLLRVTAPIVDQQANGYVDTQKLRRGLSEHTSLSAAVIVYCVANCKSQVERSLIFFHSPLSTALSHVEGLHLLSEVKFADKVYEQPKNLEGTHRDHRSNFTLGCA
jgi:hypothetical protein